MRIHALEYCAMIDVVHHLRLTFKIFEASGCAKLSLHLRQKRMHVAVPLEVPVVVSPYIVHRPLVGLRYRRLERFERRHRGRTCLDRETTIDGCVVQLRILIAIWTAVLQIHLVRAGRVIACAIQGIDQMRKALVDDWLRHTFIASAPDCDRWMIPETPDHIPCI